MGSCFISAAYTDKGGNNIRPLMGTSSVSLRNSTLTFDGVNNMQAFSKANYNGVNYMIIPQNTGWFSIDSIDLTNISRAVLTMGWQKPPVSGYTFEVHIDAPNGNKIGEFTFAGKAESGDSKTTKAAPQFWRCLQLH